MIAGWAPSVDATHAVIMYTDAGGAIYKGLAIANNGSANFLYATDFHNGKVDVFDATFKKQTPTATSFAFTDPTLPAGYAPFGIQAIKNGAGGATQIYVSYAKQAADPTTSTTRAARASGWSMSSMPTAAWSSTWSRPAARSTRPGAWRSRRATSARSAARCWWAISATAVINGFDPATGAFIGTVANAAGTPFAYPGCGASRSATTPPTSRTTRCSTPRARTTRPTAPTGGSTSARARRC
jgi:hypothetical protein